MIYRFISLREYTQSTRLAYKNKPTLMYMQSLGDLNQHVIDLVRHNSRIKKMNEQRKRMFGDRFKPVPYAGDMK